jgi:hypothetical protein
MLNPHLHAGPARYEFIIDYRVIIEIIDPVSEHSSSSTV